MNLDERVEAYGAELKALQQQIASIEQQAVLLQSRRQTLLLESKKAEGAVEAIRRLQAEAAEQPKG